MVIVLIHWYIKSDEASLTEFKQSWRDIFTIEDKSSLIGEYLSAPVPKEEFDYPVDDLRPEFREQTFVPFVNVGIWDNPESFYEQVGQYFPEKDELKPFEAKLRKRTILMPEEWRRGMTDLPDTSTCA